jgi:hypothetical protein
VNDWRDQEVRNEARSRDRNEWIEGIRGEMGQEVSTETYVCECGDATCVERIRLTRPEYEAVRAYSTRFAIAIDHENPEIDQLVTEGGGYSVVAKIAGRPARIARQTDHRHARGEDLGSSSGAGR